MIKGIIFDLDGTLLDSMFIWVTAGSNYLKARGIEPHESIDRNVKAMSLAQAASFIKKVQCLPESEQEIIDGVHKMIEHYYLNEIELKPYVLEFLSFLDKKGVKMCIATATDAPLVRAAIKRCGIDRYFKGIITCFDVGRGKDEPYIYEKALSILGTKKEETAVFEDAMYAVRTAKKAGFTVFGVADKWEEQRADKIKELSDFYITSYEGLGEKIDV